jgi:hypothetical protein
VGTMSKTLDYARESIINVHSNIRRDGPPLYLLDELTEKDKKRIENDLINAMDLSDYFPIEALGYLKSIKSIPKLYDLLYQANGPIIVHIASAIYNICADATMASVALKEVNNIQKESDISNLLIAINVISSISDVNIKKKLVELSDSKNYFVACNATRALGRSTDVVIKRFRDEGLTTNLDDPI